MATCPVRAGASHLLVATALALVCADAVARPASGPPATAGTAAPVPDPIRAEPGTASGSGNATPRVRDATRADVLPSRATHRPLSDRADRSPRTSGAVWRPAPGTSWQWQLSGTLDTTFDVDMYDIDLFDTPRATIGSLRAEGRVVICYFSAGSHESWRPDAADFPARLLGRSNGWPGERWLDVRALEVLMPIVEARLDLAREKGCDGVEPDNVDGYANASGFPLRAADQLAFNIALADAAHARGLSIGLKNDLDQVAELEPYFDWALNEQCVQYRECERLRPFVAAGKAVFGVEYTGDPARFCPRTNALDFDWLDKDLDLGPRRKACR